MLKEYYLENIYGKIDLNCAESVLYTASCVYGMNLTHESIRLSSPFGGGMYTESTCGAATGALMALGWLFVDKNAHATGYLGDIVRYYFNEFEKALGSCDCAPIKEKHRSEDYGCRDVIASSLDVLEYTIVNFSGLRVR